MKDNALNCSVKVGGTTTASAATGDGYGTSCSDITAESHSTHDRNLTSDSGSTSHWELTSDSYVTFTNTTIRSPKFSAVTIRTIAKTGSGVGQFSSIT